MNLFSWLNRQRRWSNDVFGRTENVALRIQGVREHIDSELKEIDKEPLEIMEWIDLVILGFEGAMRAGHTSHDICRALEAKQEKNIARKWDKKASEGQAVYHTKDEPANPSSAPGEASEVGE